MLTGIWWINHKDVGELTQTVQAMFLLFMAVAVGLTTFGVTVIQSFKKIKAEITDIRNRAAEAHRELREADDVTDRRVDLVWQSKMRRGLAEGVNKKLITPSEDPSVSAQLRLDVKSAYQHIAMDLRDFYAREGSGIPEEQFAEKVEAKYGDWLTRHICIPLGVSEDACVHIAVEVAKEPTSVT
jgi:hypothetical protein